MSMADRIGVMRAGSLDQVAAPSEIYERPATRFVAEFIGESNFLDATWDPSERGAYLSDGTALPLDPSLVPPTTARELTIMVRPESVRTGQAGIPATVLQTSFMGDHARVTCELSGSGREVVVRLEKPNRRMATELLPGEHTSLSWEPHDVVLFDPNGNNVTQEVAHGPVRINYPG